MVWYSLVSSIHGGFYSVSPIDAVETAVWVSSLSAQVNRALDDVLQ